MWRGNGGALTGKSHTTQPPKCGCFFSSSSRPAKTNAPRTPNMHFWHVSTINATIRVDGKAFNWNTKTLFSLSFIYLPSLPSTTSKFFVCLEKRRQDVFDLPGFPFYLADLIIFSLAKRSAADKWQVRSRNSFTAAVWLVWLMYMSASPYLRLCWTRTEAAWSMIYAFCRMHAPFTQPPSLNADVDPCSTAFKTSALLVPHSHMCSCLSWRWIYSRDAERLRSSSEILLLTFRINKSKFD